MIKPPSAPPSASSSSSTTSLSGPGLIAGAYPTASRTDPHGTTVLLQSLLLTGRVTAFVSLLADEAAGFVGYEQLATAVCEAANPPRPPPLFLSLAIRDGHVTGDAEVLELCHRLIALLRDGHILYVHCWGGHGRTGTVIAVTIGLVYGLTGQQSLDACSERHEQRRVWKGISSPQSPAQCRQVVRIIDHVQHGTPLTSLDPPPLDFLAASLSPAPTIVDRQMLEIPPADTAENPHAAHQDAADLSHQFVFTVMQWNTLASSLTDTTSFPHTEPQHLSTDHRRQLFVQELLRFSPTLVCLQEVDGVDYEQFYHPLLASRQYDSLYVKKTGEDNRDGCALFYSTAHFAMLSCTAGPLSYHRKSRSFVSTPPSTSSSPAISASAPCAASSTEPGWSQVCIIAQFAAIVDDAVHPHHRIFVACTHLKAKEGNELVRTQQLHALTQQLTHKLCRVRRLAGEVETSIIVCGDFNDTPTSSMWQLATAGQTTPTSATCPPSASTAPPTPTLSPVPPLCHSLWLHSLYDRYHALAQPNSSYWTTVKRRAVRVQRVIDYVLYSPHTLLPLALCSVPVGVDNDENGWPNAHYPSDHLALIGQFALIGQKMQRVPMAVHARHKL